jgi:hypothetical protein
VEEVAEGSQVVDFMERETGFEPATSSLGSWHSTTELLPPFGKSYSQLILKRSGIAGPSLQSFLLPFSACSDDKTNADRVRLCFPAAVFVSCFMASNYILPHGSRTRSTLANRLQADSESNPRSRLRIREVAAPVRPNPDRSPAIFAEPALCAILRFARSRKSPRVISRRRILSLESF